MEFSSLFSLKDLFIQEKDNGDKLRISYNEKQRLTVVEVTEKTSYHCILMKDGTVLKEFSSLDGFYNHIMENYI